MNDEKKKAIIDLIINHNKNIINILISNKSGPEKSLLIYTVIELFRMDFDLIISTPDEFPKGGEFIKLETNFNKEEQED